MRALRWLRLPKAERMAGTVEAPTRPVRERRASQATRKKTKTGNMNERYGKCRWIFRPVRNLCRKTVLGFVDAMHEHVDLYHACARLVKSKDEKIAQRMMERLLEMTYGKAPAAAEDQAPQIMFDAPRPIRD